MSLERRKLFDDRVLEVTGKPASELDPRWDIMDLMGLPVLQKDGTVEWSMPKTDEVPH